MKCLMKYQWVKLPRNRLPEGKGLMGYWAKLASRAAFRKGQASYCGHINAVSRDVFALYRLPGSYGCLIFNKLYPTGTEVSTPAQEDIVSILDEIRILGANTQKKGSDHEQLNRLVTWYSRRLTHPDADGSHGNEPENRVAHFAPIIRAYLSTCRNCKNCRYDCQGKSTCPEAVMETSKIRGPCVPVDITTIAKELFAYEQTG